MAPHDETRLWTTLELADRIRRGHSAVELVRTILRRIDADNPRINAVVARNDEVVLERAEQADVARDRGQWWGPLHGVPFTVKDAFETKDFATTYGTPFRFRPRRNASAVQKIVDAGAIVVGKTNLPLLSYDWQSNHPRYGRARHPHDPQRVPGGSSGGAAAALAAGLTPFELGSDVAGSIRVPCHFCGVWGLRSTVGAITTAGHAKIPGLAGAPVRMLGLGPMTRSGEDLAMLAALLQDAEVQPVPDPGSLRLRWTASIEPFAPVSEVGDAIRKLRGALEREGTRVDEDSLDAERLVALWGQINGFDLAACAPGLARLPGVRSLGAPFAFRRRFGAGTMTAALGQGFAADPAEIGSWESAARAAADAFEAQLGDAHGWLLPIAPFPAFRHVPTGASIEWRGRAFPYADALAAYNCSIAVLGVPAVAIPLTSTVDGLPVGVQLVGRRGDDHALIATARAIERAMTRQE